MRKGEAAFIMFLFLFVSFCVIGTTIQYLGVRSDKTTRLVVGQTEICVEILEPDGGRKGSIVLMHGIIGSRRMVKPLATDIVRAGWRVVLVDQIGHGDSGGRYSLNYSEIRKPIVALCRLINESEDFRRGLIEYVRRLAGGEPIIFGGHSFGALLAILMSQECDGLLNTVGTFAIAPPFVEVVNVSEVKNLLLCLGKYDEFIPVSDLKRYVDPENPDMVPVGKTIGDFRNGTARRIYVSPYSDHVFEPYDPAIAEEIIRWLDMCIGLPPGRVIPLLVLFSVIKALGSLFGLVAVAMLPIALADKLGIISGGKRFPTMRLVGVSLVASCIVWPMLTMIFLAIFFAGILSVARVLGYIMPVLIGGYVLVASIALVASSSYLAGRSVKSTLAKIYLYLRSDIARNLLLGVLEAALFLVVLEVSFGDILAPMIPRTAGRIAISILLAMMIFGYFIFHEHFFRAQIQEIFGGRRRRAVVFSILISLLSKIVVIVAITGLILLLSPFPVVATVGMLGMILVALLTEGLAATSYYATREILPHSIASAIVWASVVSAAFPVVSIALI